jgi:hypothetical protein
MDPVAEEANAAGFCAFSAVSQAIPDQRAGPIRWCTGVIPFQHRG